MNSLADFFENSNTMKVFAILATVAGIAACVLFRIIAGAADAQQVIYLFQGLLALFLFRAYRKHDKNVMKGLLGALLTTLLLNEVCYVFGTFSDKCFYLYIEEPPAYLALGIGIEVLYVALQIALFINHFVINADHHSSPKKVRLNQFLLFCLMVVILVQELFNVITMGNYTTIALIGQIVWFVLEISSYAVIVCIESKLDAYRILREN